MTRVFQGEISYFLPLNFLPEELIFVISKKFIGFINAKPALGGKSDIIKFLNEKALGFSERSRCHAESNTLCIYGDSPEILVLTYINNRFEELILKSSGDKIAYAYLQSNSSLVSIAMKEKQYLFIQWDLLTKKQTIRDLAKDSEFTTFLLQYGEHKISFDFDKIIIAKKEFPHDQVERLNYYYGVMEPRDRNLLVIAKITNENTTLIEHHRCQVNSFCTICTKIIPNEPRFGYVRKTIIDFKTKRKYHIERYGQQKLFKTNGRIVVTKKKKTLDITELHLNPLKFKIIVALGLTFSGKFNKFLTRGLYDPRLLMIIDSYA